MEPGRPSRRSREGCWTCKKRRKKCDNGSSPCNNCKRLGLECDRGTRLVWEDDVRRDGMKRRGPPLRKPNVEGKLGSSHLKDTLTLSSPLFDQGALTSDARIFPQVSDWPFGLDSTDCQLLDRYVQLFSKTYPTCTDPNNPFVRVFLPLSTRSRPVLDAVLALSCVQSWEDGNFTMRMPMLRYRTKAIRGCKEMVSSMMKKSGFHHETPMTSVAFDNEENTQLLAICVLLMLYEKLSGESQENGTIHLQVFSQLFPTQLFVTILDKIAYEPTIRHQNDAISFLSNLFLYNDLVRSTSLRTSTLSDFYFHKTAGFPWTEEMMNRFYFPSVIARISANDISVTDADITAWNGRLDWLPSFALQPAEKDEKREKLPTEDTGFVHNPGFEDLESFTCVGTWNESTLTCELYRVAATVYRKQCQLDSPDSAMGNLPAWAIAILRRIPLGSQYDTALLWPIAIVAREFTQWHDREYVLLRLRMLEERFKMKNYCVVREHLLQIWKYRDSGIPCENIRVSLFG
ncbi:fungal-specific transcription factor domain-containing protein [Hypoxylon trugodes]|uniref:fungal-specific transcription factor domain-containing protein n=1 Tax=Hypoxylon trugodes TaxID=326681 RepID=UPI002196B760|nr:fungal-specific transcription factor domain-containing protein [Hypoxylon trugodes]KAI1386435.1 fungal-specific transcription factor domain-containing protein [Hypoxylon trugodes]